MSRQTNNNKQNQNVFSVPQWPSDISGNDWRSPVISSPAADGMSDEILGVNQVLLSRNYRCANPLVEKSIA